MCENIEQAVVPRLMIASDIKTREPHILGRSEGGQSPGDMQIVTPQLLG